MFIVSGQVFPGATSLAYTDNASPMEKIVVPSVNGVFKIPQGGWGSDKKYHVIKGNGKIYLHTYIRASLGI